MAKISHQKYIENLGFKVIKSLEGGFSHVYQASNESSSVIVKLGDICCRYGCRHVTTENRVLDRVKGVEGIAEKISFHELETNPRLVALVKKYIEGKDIFNACIHKIPNPNVLINAVNALHGSGVANLDLFPGNIIIDPSKKPWLIDFGFCSFEEDIPKRRFESYKNMDLKSLEFYVN